jgi:hypothetical protein
MAMSIVIFLSCLLLIGVLVALATVIYLTAKYLGSTFAILFLLALISLAAAILTDFAS